MRITEVHAEKIDYGNGQRLSFGFNVDHSNIPKYRDLIDIVRGMTINEVCAKLRALADRLERTK